MGRFQICFIFDIDIRTSILDSNTDSWASTRSGISVLSLDSRLRNWFLIRRIWFPIPVIDSWFRSLSIWFRSLSWIPPEGIGIRIDFTGWLSIGGHRSSVILYSDLYYWVVYLLRSSDYKFWRLDTSHSLLNGRKR